MSEKRPSLQGKDSSGRRISLINGPDLFGQGATTLHTLSSLTPSFHVPFGASSAAAVDMGRSPSKESDNSSISLPGLLRSDSYDSQNTNDTRSPITPTFISYHGRQHSYTGTNPFPKSSTSPHEFRTAFDDYHLPTATIQRQSQYGQSLFEEARNRVHLMYDEEPFVNTAASDREPKRYPCRFRIDQNCPKTFTTSGHASRHSGIHTAEKAVPCSYPGCRKKFTRADNMKQHLDTHTKDKPRKLTIAAGVRKSSPSVKTTSRPTTPMRRASHAEIPPFVENASPVGRYAGTISLTPTSPLNMGRFSQNLPPMDGTRKNHIRNTQSLGSLDLLADAATLR